MNRKTIPDFEACISFSIFIASIVRQGTHQHRSRTAARRKDPARQGHGAHCRRRGKGEAEAHRRGHGRLVRRARGRR